MIAASPRGPRVALVLLDAGMRHGTAHAALPGCPVARRRADRPAHRPRRTAEAVGEALVRLAGAPDLRARMGRIGRERALAFGPKRFTGSVLEACRVLPGQTRTGSAPIQGRR